MIGKGSIIQSYTSTSRTESYTPSSRTAASGMDSSAQCLLHRRALALLLPIGVRSYLWHEAEDGDRLPVHGLVVLE